jgi:2-dehydro-3-deoxyphosphogluconate aldolase/(4S)-4-hydroxy-2-oxoglutarate aldolase
MTGAHVVNVSSASLGGPALLKALRGPCPDVSFVPTSGVNAANPGDWLAAGAVAQQFAAAAQAAREAQA